MSADKFCLSLQWNTNAVSKKKRLVGGWGNEVKQWGADELEEMGWRKFLVPFQTLVFLLKKPISRVDLSLPFPRPSPLIPSLTLSLLYPRLSAFVINPFYHLCRLYFPHSTTLHHLGIIISAILVLSFPPVSFVLWGLHSGNTDDSSQGPFWSRLSTVSGPHHLGSPL